MMHWYHVKHTDTRARLLADRHYSRQSPGATYFTPPGNKIVLIVPGPDANALAVWASQRPAPGTGLEVRADGFQYWNNVIFRNESGLRSSDLIQEAVAVTRHFWHELPVDGFHSFVDPSAVQGVKVRGKLIHGFSFMKAGFQLHSERTKQRGLLRWILPLEQLLQVEPVPPQYEQLALGI